MPPEKPKFTFTITVIIACVLAFVGSALLFHKALNTDDTPTPATQAATTQQEK